MALEARLVEEHIATWEKRLQNPFFGHRSKWPSRLFHHAPIENAAEILRTGKLLSRADSEQCRKRDVADPGVIETRNRAHHFARLYFRPRTPTQFHIEGIRRSSDLHRGDPRIHAPILVMLVFNSRQVLTKTGTRFSDSNMQSPASRDGDNEEFFAQIDFSKVYHEGPIGNDRTIIACRCAEVLAESPLNISECLQWVYCRSQAERLMLIHLLGKDSMKWRDKIVVSDDIKVFEKKYTYVDRAELQSDGLLLKLHPRFDGTHVSIRLNVSNARGRTVITYGSSTFSPVPANGDLWLFKGDIRSGTYIVTIDLEGHRAFSANLIYDDDPF